MFFSTIFEDVRNTKLCEQEQYRGKQDTSKVLKVIDEVMLRDGQMSGQRKPAKTHV